MGGGGGGGGGKNWLYEQSEWIGGGGQRQSLWALIA